ncbi:MAG: hypothetical protein ACP5E5_14665 [Acidobacteriaceae bacterium]
MGWEKVYFGLDGVNLAKALRAQENAKNARNGEAGSGCQLAAILACRTSTCRRHEINPQIYLTQLLDNLPTLPISDLDWLPDRWKVTRTIRLAAL